MDFFHTSFAFALTFFFKMQSKIGVRIIHGRVLYTGKYGNQIAWKFNLERTPWWGGFYESLIGTA